MANAAEFKDMTSLIKVGKKRPTAEPTVTDETPKVVDVATEEGTNKRVKIDEEKNDNG
jgi:hypothetical protein